MSSHRGIFVCIVWCLAHSTLFGDEEPGPAPSTLRLLTHNVYMGFTKENAVHHGRWREWVARQRPDVVALQELNSYTADKLAADAAAWGHPYAILLKEDGFPIGLTSRWPIDDVTRVKEGFHHGLLRGRVQGIYVYAIHLHPADWEHRRREVALLAKNVAALPPGNRGVILAGDFNGLSPADRNHYAKLPTLIPFFENLDRRDPRAKNLNAGHIDYGCIQAIIDQGFVDTCPRSRQPDLEFVGTFPSPLVEKLDHGPERRLDYIFVSPNLADAVMANRILRDAESRSFSDHFPVMVELDLSVR